MAEDNKLWVVVETEAVEETVEVEGRRSGSDTGGGFGVPDAVEQVRAFSKRRRVSLDAQALKGQMESLIGIMNDIFAEAETQNGLRLDEVELFC